MSLAGQTAVVTGGGRGIGRAVALALAREGARVAVAARTLAQLEQVAREIRKEGGEALAVATDVSSAGDVAALFSASERTFGPVDVLVNNAGVVARRPFVELSEADWDLQLDVNLKGAFLCARAALAGPTGMLSRRRGRIVNVSSISGTLGTPKLAAYCASKWGLIGLTKALAAELSGSGVSVTAVLPGSVDTEMLVGSGFAPDLGPDDVARVIRFLAAEAPEAMTGSAVEIFG